MESSPAGRPAPESPTKIPRRGLVEGSKRTASEFRDDNLTDWAAALTYYGVLASSLRCSPWSRSSVWSASPRRSR